MMLSVPPYVAVMVLLPLGNAPVVTLAFPARLSETLPSVVVPAVNVTVPVTLAVGLVTFAVNVTG